MRTEFQEKSFFRKSEKEANEIHLANLKCLMKRQLSLKSVRHATPKPRGDIRLFLRYKTSGGKGMKRDLCIYERFLKKFLRPKKE